MIEFNNVTKKYGDNVGLIDATVHIHKGDFVFLVGPSGAGKTTFIKLILKEIDPDRGSIKLAGKDITRLGRREIPAIRQKIGMVFQDFRLLEKKTVYENVAFAMEVLHKSKREIRQNVPDVLELVDIADKAGNYPAELSAGEQQRVGIARALVNQPRVLICDEPTGNLDPITAMEIMYILEQINVRGTTVLMVTHAKDIVDKMNKRVVAIDQGRIVRDEAGTYGFHKKNPYEETHVVPDMSSLYTPEQLAAMEKRQTMYMEQSIQMIQPSRSMILQQTPEGHGVSDLAAPYISTSDDAVEDMLAQYLDAGEDLYE
jgi:cell division transport system ATP-binding protein